jgi:pantetheine-phosphate adenylyltransferase
MLNCEGAYMSKAIYPGTFDPVTRGHVDIARRAARLFDEVVVAVGLNPTKKPIFTLDERVQMVREELTDVRKITVDTFDGLLVQYLERKGIYVVLRGIRPAVDMEFESEMALTNRAMLPQMETVFIVAAPEYAFVRGQLIREIAAAGGDLSPFLSARVAERLRERTR